MDEAAKKDRRTASISVVVCLVLQLAIAPNIAVGGARPDFLLVAVVVVAMFQGSRFACVFGAACGLLMDLTSTSPFGAYLIALSLAGWVCGMLVKGLIFESWVMSAVFLVLCALGSEFLISVLMAFCGSNEHFLQSIYKVVLPSALYDAVFALIAFPLLRRFLSNRPGTVSTTRKLV